MRPGAEPVSLGNCKAVRATAKAILIIDADEMQKWIPKSQIHDDSEVWKVGDYGDLVITEWFAEKEGWL